MLKEATAFCNQDYNLRESEDGSEKEGCQNPRKGIFQATATPEAQNKGLRGQRAVQNTWLWICSLTRPTTSDLVKESYSGTCSNSWKILFKTIASGKRDGIQF